jgi:hypothetical protein
LGGIGLQPLQSPKAWGRHEAIVRWKELRRIKSCKGITRDDDCRSEHTLDESAVAKTGRAAEHIQTALIPHGRNAIFTK